MMATRKLTTFYCLETLNLKPETLSILKGMGVSTRNLVMTARSDFAWRTYMPSEANKSKANKLLQIPGIGEVRAEEIIAAVDAAGFLLHEKDLSCNYRRLMSAVNGDPKLFIEHYDELEDMAPEALMAASAALHEALSQHELELIELRYGLKDGRCHAIKSCAKITGMHIESMNQTISKALSKLRHSNYRSKLEIATCYSCEALSNRINELRHLIGNLQQELNSLMADSPYPELQVETTPIDSLNLSRRTIIPLMRAGVSTVEQLSEYTDADLLKIRNFGQQQLEEVHWSLQKVDMTKVLISN